MTVPANKPNPLIPGHMKILCIAAGAALLLLLFPRAGGSADSLPPHETMPRVVLIDDRPSSRVLAELRSLKLDIAHISHELEALRNEIREMKPCTCNAAAAEDIPLP